MSLSAWNPETGNCGNTQILEPSKLESEGSKEPWSPEAHAPLLPELQAILNLARSLFLVLLFALGAYFINRDTRQLVLVPIERMVAIVQDMAQNPLQGLHGAGRQLGPAAWPHNGGGGASSDEVGPGGGGGGASGGGGGVSGGSGGALSDEVGPDEGAVTLRGP